MKVHSRFLDVFIFLPEQKVGSRLWCLTVSLSLSHWYPGSTWYLIVSIPDLSTLTYF